MERNQICNSSKRHALNKTKHMRKLRNKNVNKNSRRARQNKTTMSASLTIWNQTGSQYPCWHREFPAFIQCSTFHPALHCCVARPTTLPPIQYLLFILLRKLYSFRLPLPHIVRCTSWRGFCTLRL